MVCDKDCKVVADQVYDVDVKKTKKPLKKGQTLNSSDLTEQYKILKTVDNQKNGMQAMAVVALNR